MAADQPEKDIIESDEVGGDKITVGDIKESKAVSVGSGTAINVEHADQVIIGGESTKPSLRRIPISPPDQLFGREAICERITQTLDENGALLLYGMGGMGKTALAATVAAKAVQDESCYPGGVLWLTVLEKSLEVLCDDIFRDAGEIELVKLPSDQKPGVVRRMLGGEGLLIVLDDVTPDTSGGNTAREWKQQAHPPNTPLLVTSRSELVGFAGQSVEELDREDAKALLRHHMGRAADRLGDDSADQICEALGDHPLALQLLGEHLKQFYTTDPAAVLGDFADARKWIDRLKVGEGVDKDDSVFVSMTLSWQRLDGNQRLVLSRLAACFAESTGTELLTLVCGLEEDAFRVAIGGLYNRSLVREENGRWSMHALVHGFVKAALDQSDWGVANWAVIEGCARYTNAYISQSRADHDLRVAEESNLELAQVWLMGVMIGIRAARISATHLGAAYAALGRVERAIETYCQILVINHEIGNRNDEEKTLGNLGAAYYRLGQVERTIDYHLQALAISREIGACRSEEDILINLGEAYAALGQIEQAIDYHQQQLEIAREIGDQHGEGKALGNLGLAYAALGQVEQAIDYDQQALLIAREIGNRRGEEQALVNLGNAYATLRRVERAIDYYQQSLAISREIGDQRGEGNDLGGLGLAYVALEQVEQAIDYCQQQLEIVREIGDRRGEGITLFNIGLALGVQPNIDQAIRHIEQARAIFVEIKAPYVKDCDDVLDRLRRGEGG